MLHRDKAPEGAPCWADLWTSDVEGSRRFYADLFGWEAQEPSAEFGGYFMFHRDGVPVAGAMGDMGDMPADDSWKVFLATDDIARTVREAEAAGAMVAAPPVPIADLGVQAVMVDPTGARVGAWQAGTFPGFTVLGEHGAPSWSELHTRDYPAALDFYRTVFRWQTQVVGDDDHFRYSVMRDPSGDGELAGIMDAAGFLPPDQGAQWSVYWEVDDVAASVARVRELGGGVVMEPEDTPYGTLASVADPAGAAFKLRTGPS
ncbi:MAG: VOC family protein [Acidimicrobiales bacterium]